MVLGAVERQGEPILCGPVDKVLGFEHENLNSFICS